MHEALLAWGKVDDVYAIRRTECARTKQTKYGRTSVSIAACDYKDQQNMKWSYTPHANESEEGVGHIFSSSSSSPLLLMLRLKMIGGRGGSGRTRRSSRRSRRTRGRRSRRSNRRSRGTRRGGGGGGTGWGSRG